MAKPFVFSDAFIPPSFLGREHEIAELRECIEPALEGRRPIHAWLHGPSGSGKTTLVRSLLSEMTAEKGLGWVLINCWEDATSYLVLERLCRELRILRAEQQSTSIKMDRLQRHWGNTPFIVVLDEIDMMAPKERASILYLLGNIGRVGLVAIAYNLKSLAALDARVRSRLSPRVIHVKPYSTADIASILKLRAAEGLQAGSCDDGLIGAVARRSGKNARAAIQLLGKAAHLAERANADRLTEQHFEAVREDVDSVSAIRAARYLNTHHRLLHEIVDSSGGISSTDLRGAYVQRCSDRKLAPVAERTFLVYLNRLIRLRLVDEEYVIDKGKRRVLRPVGTATRNNSSGLDTPQGNEQSDPAR